MTNLKLDLAMYAESNDELDADFEDGGAQDQPKPERNKKTSDWAKGKTRAQPSENWDDDFFFGSASTESLPLPSKDSNSTLSSNNDPGHRQQYKKPASSQSIEPLLHHSQSSRSVNHHHSGSRPYQKQSQSYLGNSKRSIKASVPEESPPSTEKDHSIVLRTQDSNSSTPRKHSSNSSSSRNPPPPPINCHPSSSLPRAPSEESNMGNHSCLPTSRSPAIRCKPGLFRPPSSAPTSRGPSKDGFAPTHLNEQRRVSEQDHLQPSPREPSNPSEPRKHTIHSSRPPVSLTRRPSTLHKAVSSQDSVPSISDLSSNGFRSPSSSLSMTDESRGDWSRSSGDYSTRFGERGSGNQSFNTETEFTEPETELDWQDDTDLEYRSSCSVVVRSSGVRGRGQSRPSARGCDSHPHSASSSIQPHSHTLAGRRQSLKAPPTSATYQVPSPASLCQVELIASSSSTRETKSSRRDRRAGHSSGDSQSTFLFAHNSKPKSAVASSILPPGLPSDASLTSSIGYSKSNHSDLSLSSSASVMLCPSSGMSGLDQGTEGSTRRQGPNRTPPLRTAHSRAHLAYQSGSESYDAATSGTETDCVSERGHGIGRRAKKFEHGPGVPTSSNSSRATPTANQRSRKQALYSRPSYVNPSPTLTSLAHSTSSSVLTSSQSSADQSKLIPDPRALHAGEEEKSSRGNFFKKRLRKKKPSLLPLSQSSKGPTGVLDSSFNRLVTHDGLPRKASVSDSLYASSPSIPSGDLAFAADSDDEERNQRRWNRADRSPSPFEIVENAEPSVVSAPLAASFRSGVQSRGLSIRSRSSILRSSVSSTSQSLSPSDQDAPAIAADETSKKFKSRRPLSFTALLSRTSISAISQPVCAAASSSGNDENKNTSSNRTTTLADQSQKPPRMRFGHRHAASIGSNPVVYPIETTSVTASPPRDSHESLMSRMRRLSSRPSSANKSTPPSSPAKKRFSLRESASGRRTSLLSSPPTPNSETQIPLTPLNESLAQTPLSPPVQHTSRPGISGSQSVASDLTLKCANQNTVRGRRSSHKSSASPLSTPSDSRTGSLSLVRKPSGRSGRKNTIDLSNTNKSLSGDSDHSSVTNSSRPSSSKAGRRTLSSKPPKSNPALRMKAKNSSSNSLFSDYRVQTTIQSLPNSAESSDVSPKDLQFVKSVIPSNSRLEHIKQAQCQAPSSEPVPDKSQKEANNSDANSQNSLTYGVTGPLARSNSMGELRIPSRITSQQGRLQAELNQVKEFARGIEELKSMRHTYQKIIMATHRLNSKCDSFTEESSIASTDSEIATDSQPLTPVEPTNPGSLVLEDQNQVSPKALNKLYSTIHKIQEEYKEWWTCCNVLIDLGEGSTDPRARFSPERLRAISCYSATLPKPSSSSSLVSSSKPPIVGEDGVANNPKKHYEILKSMFGPGDGDSSSGKGSNAAESTRTYPLEDSSDSQSLSETSQIRKTPPPSMLSALKKVTDHTPSSRLSYPESWSDDLETPTGPDRTVKVHATQAGVSQIASTGKSDPLSPEALIDCKMVMVSSEPLPAQDKPVPSSTAGHKEKRKPNYRHNSYTHQSRNSRPASESAGAIGRLSAGGRMGIRPIKDFLRVLKARVNAEEVWPLKSKSMMVPISNSTSRRTVSSPVVQEATTRSTMSYSSSPPVTMGASNVAPTVFKTIEEDESPKTPEKGKIRRERSPSVHSSDEECWDDLFGLQDNSRTDSLDLALPGSGSTQNPRRKKMGFVEGRLALSSDRMPQLLSYLSVVKEQCMECLTELKSQTV